jgi:hypothetical protein
MEAILAAALELLSDSVNVGTGLVHPSDRERASELFVRLVAAEVSLPPDVIEQVALEHDWLPRDAHDLAQRAARIAGGLRPRMSGGPYWSEDIIDRLRKLATNSDAAGR